MTPEEFERLKETEKEHLRKLKQLKEAVRVLERQRSLHQTIQQMSGAAEDALNTQAEMVEKLAMETAHFEARSDLALEAEAEQDRIERMAEQERLDELERQRRAEDLVRQMKQELGTVAPDVASPRDGATPDAGAGERPQAETPANPTRSPGPRPEKTIGRM